VLVAREEGTRLRWQVIALRHALARAQRAQVRAQVAVVFVERDAHVGGAQPQRPAHQRERRGVEAAVELHVAVAMHGDAVPAAQVGRDRGQAPHQRALEREQHQRLLARRAMHTPSRLLRHPHARLRVEVGHVAEAARGQEVALDVLHAGFDDALLLRIVRRAGVDLEAIALGAFGVGALHERVVAAGLDDGALGVVDDQPLGHAVEPLEGAAVAAQPGRHRLIPDELDVLVAAVGQRHHEGPGAARLAVRVGEHRAGAEVHLRGIGRRERQPHRRLRRLRCAHALQHPPHRGVAAGEGVLALEGGVDRAALHAGVEPALDHLAQRLDVGDGGGRSLAGLHRLGDGLVLGQRGAGIQPAERLRDPHQLVGLVATQEAAARHLARRVARAQTHEHLSELEHLDPSATHRAALRAKSSDGSAGVIEDSRRLLGTGDWPVYADHDVAGICRSWTGR